MIAHLELYWFIFGSAISKEHFSCRGRVLRIAQDFSVIMIVKKGDRIETAQADEAGMQDERKQN